MELTYACRPLHESQRRAWFYAVASVVAPYIGCLGIFLVRRIQQFPNARTAAFYISCWLLTCYTASIVCGIVGMGQATRAQSRYARVVAFIGLIFGVTLFIGLGIVVANYIIRMGLK